MTTPRTMTTLPVVWHEDAVKRALDHARYLADVRTDDTPIRDGVPLTWQDVAVLVDIARNLDENQSTLAWLHAEAKHQLGEAHSEISDLRDRARRVRENEHIGYVDHFNELINALGQHADPSARSLHQLIDRDVTALRESYDEIETELIEWRTGVRTPDTNAEQWAKVNATLDETLATVRQLAGRIDAAPAEHLSGQLPTEAEPHDVDIHEDTESVRGPGWYVAECSCGNWSTSGREPVVEQAAYEHKHPAEPAVHEG